MANADAIVSVCKYVISIISLWIIITVVLNKFYTVRPLFLPKTVGVSYQHRASLKRETTRPYGVKTPPWISLLADYQDTVSSLRNLYLWPALINGYRLGNILFNYAATFGIAWRNRRIPLWPNKPADKQYDITKFFNLRIPVDKNKTIMQVRLTVNVKYLYSECHCLS